MPLCHTRSHLRSSTTYRTPTVPPPQPHPPLWYPPLTLPPSPVVRDVTARGIRTRVVESGSGPPLLFIHGFLANHATFDDVVPPLAHSFHVIAVDLPGFGSSEKPPPSRFAYSVEAFAEIVTDAIAALPGGRRHRRGHGRGAAVALALASEHAEFVDHLVLVAPEVFPTSPSNFTRVMLLPLVGGILFKQVLGRSMFRSFFQTHMYGPGHPVPVDRIDDYFKDFSSPAARESAYAVLRNQLDMRPSAARLTRVKAPTLVVWGRADVRLPSDAAQRMVRQLPNARLTFLDSGHSPHEEQPDAFVAAVERFFLAPES